MRIMADENVAGAVVRALRAGGHDVNWIAETAKGSPDSFVLAIVVKESRILLTHDKEFAAAAGRRNVRGLQGIILLRLDGMGPDEVGEFVTRTLGCRTDWVGKLAIVKPKIIRMRNLA